MTPLPGIEKTIDGTRYYVTESGSKIIADQWDKMHLPAHNLKIRNERYKGENKCKKNRWLKGEKSY